MSSVAAACLAAYISHARKKLHSRGKWYDLFLPGPILMIQAPFSRAWIASCTICVKIN